MSQSTLSYTCRIDHQEISGTLPSKESRSSPINARDLFSVYDAVRDEVGAPKTKEVTCKIVQRERNAIQTKDMEWIQRRMGPSCRAYGWDPSHVISFDRFECRYMGTGTVPGTDGKDTPLYNPFRTWSGTLASCDAGSAKSMGISDEQMKAIQTYAHYQADGDASGLDPSKFLCRVESLPGH